MEYYIAFDAGGTKLAAVLFDGTGRVLSGARTGGTNSGSGSAEARLASIASCVDILFDTAGETVPAVAAVYGHLFGDHNDYRAAIECHCPCGPFLIRDEGMLGVLACGETDGVVVLSGTGSNTFYMQNCRTVRSAGGWGYAVEDLGSGYDIGRCAMQHVRRIIDRGLPSTRLFETVTGHLGADTVSAILDKLYGDRAPARAMAALVPAVNQAAFEGDAQARTILRRAGEQLAEEAVCLLQLCDAPPDVAVCLTGGVLDNCPSVRRALEQAVRGTYPDARIKRPRMSPVFGGVLYHFVHSGLPVTAERVEDIRRQARRFAV